MLEAAAAVGQQLFDIQFVILLMMGVTVGALFGALPGLTPPIALAMIMPFTFTMDPMSGLSVLAAIYMAAEYGGSISAILINTPGTAAAVCTLLDGFPMAQKGQAQRALHASVIGSAIGGALGVVVLLFLTPPLAKVALLLGPPEMFWLAMAGLSLVCSLGGDSFIKGLIPATFGLWLSIIGQDLSTGVNRFVYGSPSLLSGIPLVPAFMGFFGIAQMLDLAGSTKNYVVEEVEKGNTFFEVLTYVLKRPFLVLRSSIIGVFVGILPGAGASIASFISYAEAKRASKTPEEFGQGHIDGVISAETANNAMVGGSLVPLLAFGIPGSGTAAILFGALIFYGLDPGPRLFETDSTIVYGFIISLFPSLLGMLIFGSVGAPLFSRVLKIRTSYIIPAVMALALIGSYSVRNNTMDLFIMAGCGIIGFIFLKFGFKMAPLILGFILGTIAESSFRQTLSIAQAKSNLITYWMHRPISIVLVISILVIIAVQILRLRKPEKGGK